MSTAIAVPRNAAATFLTHFFGSGLADDTHVVERFKAYVAATTDPVLWRVIDKIEVNIIFAALHGAHDRGPSKRETRSCSQNHSRRQTRSTNTKRHRSPNSG